MKELRRLQSLATVETLGPKLRFERGAAARLDQGFYRGLYFLSPLSPPQGSIEKIHSRAQLLLCRLNTHRPLPPLLAQGNLRQTPNLGLCARGIAFPCHVDPVDTESRQMK